MYSQAVDAAIVAVFHRQLPFNRAVRFVTQETRVAPEVAERALAEAMTWYRAH